MIAEDPITHGSMFVPIILGSDKTTVSVATGNNEYWPVYLSIGNIHNNVRRAHRDGLVLLGFLAVPKSKRKVVMRSWFNINNTIKPTKSILMMSIFANSAVSYIIPPLQKFSSLSSPAWQLPRSYFVPMATIGAPFMDLDLTLQTIPNKPSWPVSYKVGVRSKFSFSKNSPLSWTASLDAQHQPKTLTVVMRHAVAENTRTF